jgi:hypothetical protein
MSRNVTEKAKAKRASISRRDLMRQASATAATAALMSAVKAAFPGGVFAQGAGPEVKKATLGFIALTDSPSTACRTWRSPSRLRGGQRATT